MNQSILVENLTRIINEFLVIKQKEVTLDSNEMQSVKMFYLSEDKRNISPFGY